MKILQGTYHNTHGYRVVVKIKVQTQQQGTQQAHNRHNNTASQLILRYKHNNRHTTGTQQAQQHGITTNTVIEVKNKKFSFFPFFLCVTCLPAYLRNQAEERANEI